MADKFVRGVDGVTYYSTGTFGSPVWVSVPQIVNVETGGDAETADGSRRAGGGMKQFMATLLDYSTTFNMIWNLGDAAFAALLVAFNARSELDMIFLDGLQTSGSHQGPRISATFAKFKRKEDLNGIMQADCEAKPGMTNIPVWFTGAA